MATSFEDLEVYKLACRLADAVWACVEPWPAFARDTVGKQLLRASDSVAANLAEGDARGSDADFRRFLFIARGSLYETKHWVQTGVRRGLIAPEEGTALEVLLDELLPRLNALIRAVNRRMHELREPDTPYGQASPDAELDLR